MTNVGQGAKKRRRLIRLGKRPMVKLEKTELILKIVQAFKILDDRSFDHYKGENMVAKPNYKGPYTYKVLAWTDTEDHHRLYETDEFTTFKTRSCKFNNEELKIPLDEDDDSPQAKYLYVELVKRSKWRDPGTSKRSRYVVIGRGRIKLPDPTSHGREFTCKVCLLGLNSDRCFVSKGVLEFSLKLLRFKV